MLKNSTKEILLQDLIQTKQMLVDAFDDKEAPFVKGGSIDQFFTGKALEFQRNIIMYHALLKSQSVDDSEGNISELSPMEKIANDLSDIKSKLNH